MHPSRFQLPGQLRASLTGPAWRRTIGSGNYTEYCPGQAPDKRPLHDVGDVREVLQQRFGMQLPEDPRLDPAINDWLQRSRAATLAPSPCSAELGLLGQQQPSMGSALRNRARLQRNTVAFTVEDLGHAPVARVGRSEAQRSARLQCTLRAHLRSSTPM